MLVHCWQPYKPDVFLIHQLWALSSASSSLCLLASCSQNCLLPLVAVHHVFSLPSLCLHHLYEYVPGVCLRLSVWIQTHTRRRSRVDKLACAGPAIAAGVPIQ